AQGHDLDNIQQSFPQLRYREPMLLLRNTGHGFEDVSASSGAVFQQRWVGRGLATGDLYNDGRVDAVVTTNGGQVHILRNKTVNGNHWLTLTLVGHKSNRDGIGAVAEVVTSSGSQYATVTTAGSYLSSSDKRLHFGLGHDAFAKEIHIRWPSGTTQTLTNVKGDRFLVINEPMR
ncbi:MAG: ASPIC/UnbV domain-containing protein, partial [Bryobacteraceae bacterium]